MIDAARNFLSLMVILSVTMILNDNSFVSSFSMTPKRIQSRPCHRLQLQQVSRHRLNDDGEDSKLDKHHHRRQFLQSSVAILLTGLSTFPKRSSAAAPPNNPLNLKGSFWETGELYDKSKQQPLSFEPDDILEYLQTQVKVLKSLESLVIDGNYSQLSKSLRGGMMSETTLRKQGYALVDLMDDETTDNNAFLASDALRMFFNSWDSLDRTVDGASKSSVGGVAETLGLAVLSPYNAANQIARISSVTTSSSSSSTSSSSMSMDPRILVLDQLTKTTQALETFITLSKKAL